MKWKRIFLTIVILLWCFGLWFIAGPLRQEFSHTYHHWLSGLGSTEMPTLTKFLSLPILGDEYHLGVKTSFLFYLYWGILWIFPLILGVSAWRVREPQRLLEIWVYMWSFYLAFLFCTGVAIIAGLWLPFSLL